MITKDILKQIILSNLGGSQTKIELTDEDLDFIIYQAVQYYIDYSSDGLNEEWIGLKLKAGTNLQEVPDDVEFIISLNATPGTGSGVVLIPETFGTSYEITMLSMIANDNNLQKPTNPVPTRIIYKDGKRYFKIDKILSSDLVVAARVMTYKSLEAIYSSSWVQRYATALAKMTLGLIRSKYQSLSAPNDMSMNGQDLISQAQQEIADLRQELSDISVMSNGGIIVG